jgi:hypothetical protein
MLSAAIEEGKLVKGDEDVGFVYFEPLSETEAGFELRVNLEAESPQANSANLRFPFVVKG